MTRPAIDTLADALSTLYGNGDIRFGHSSDEAMDEAREALASLRRLLEAAQALPEMNDEPRTDEFERERPLRWAEFRAALAGCVGDPAPVPGAEEGQP